MGMGELAAPRTLKEDEGTAKAPRKLQLQNKRKYVAENGNTASCIAILLTLTISQVFNFALYFCPVRQPYHLSSMDKCISWNTSYELLLMFSALFLMRYQCFHES